MMTWEQEFLQADEEDGGGDEMVVMVGKMGSEVVGDGVYG